MLKLISVFFFFLTSGLLLWYFLKTDRGTKEPAGALWAAFGFGILGIGAAMWAELLFLPNPDTKVSVLPLFLIALAVGVIEESSKSVPLALFLRKKDYFNEHTDGIIYFAISGLTFGLVENLLYVFAYSNRLGTSELTGVLRLVILFFFHAASAGIVGYYFAKAKVQHQNVMRAVVALLIMATFHGTYDFLFLYASSVARTARYLTDGKAALIAFALVGGLIMSALLNTCLFLYYKRAREWDVSMGLATDPKLQNQTTAVPPQSNNAGTQTPLNQQHA